MPRKHRPARPREPKACRACAYAKVRCVSEPQAELGDPCKRCVRLKRGCMMQAPGAHKRAGESSLDVTRLEEKLDGMAAAFTASRTPLPVDTGGDGGLSTSLLDESLLPRDEAEMALYTFRTEMAPYFPFIVVHPHTTVSEMRRAKPFLFDAIAMVSCLDADRQSEMAHMVSEHIGTLIITKGERNLDLLQGLLVCLAWYHFQLERGSQLCSVHHLAWVMLINLDLNRNPSLVNSMPMRDFLGDTAKQNTSHTLEEQRAYLGCFYMSAVLSTCLQGTNSMKYTDYTKECCRVIEHAAEYPTDLYLVRLVRLHRLADRISRTLSRDEIDLPGYPSPPISLCINVLEAELQHLKPPLPPASLHDLIFLMHHHNLELSLYEIALRDDFPARHRIHPTERVNILSSCLSATKSFIDQFSSIPPRFYLNLPYPVYAAYCHAIGTLSNLLLFSGEGWDPEYARSKIDIPNVLTMLIIKIENAAETSRHEQPPYRFPEAFVGLVPRLRAIGENHEARRAAALQDKPGGSASDDDSGSATQDVTQDMMFQLPHGFSWRFLQPR
ncbi:hypothetical protein BDW59DRAFT_65165 [Aspergillus cavernicola]|uniref:Zn(2)-C6 fungal-type domain-containing protein n=1 Tax=Aspergillus cavernicola TaxID=176166 RepID=A0ABR4IFC5_9EURO